MLKLFIENEITDVTNAILNEMNFLNENEVLELVENANEMLNEVIYTQIRDSVRFDLINNQTNEFYKGMLGNGNQIEFMDLYEILKRLYSYHHVSQSFILKFEGYEIEINYENLNTLPTTFHVFQLIKQAIGYKNFVTLNSILN